MSKGNKVTFKVILTSEIEQPFKVISVPEEAPFSAVIRYVCDEVCPCSISVQSRRKNHLDTNNGRSGYQP